VGALVLTDRSPKDISSIVVFAPGRGGRKDDRANSICAPDRPIAAAKEFGEDARVPVTWLVAENDSFFRRSSQSRWPTRSSKRGRQGGCSGAAAVRQGRPLVAEAGDEAMLAALIGNAAGLTMQTSLAQGASVKKKP
jgi:hypothetical protein